MQRNDDRRLVGLGVTGRQQSLGLEERQPLGPFGVGVLLLTGDVVEETEIYGSEQAPAAP